MINVELYVNNQLCDIVSPYELGVRFQREILIPSEITTKDVQYSFTIKLPTSATNNKIFNFANVEEVKNKFNYEYNAILIVDSITVFTGKFKITEIDEEVYKGNLYIPAAKTIKEIFNGKKMTENGNWYIPFKDIGSVGGYNSKMITELQDCIFPIVLYGLLPKNPINSNAIENGEVVGEYTPKDEFDDYVRMGIEDFPPSVNVLRMLRKIFENNGYTLGGTAFEDTRLTNLFVSYKNESDYEQEWNWGDMASFKVKGNWESVRNRWQNYRTFERNIERVESDKGAFYVTDLLNCNRTVITEISDTGRNLTTSVEKDKWNDENYMKRKTLITIPKSGLYKVRLKGSIELEQGRDNSGKDSGWKWTDNVTGNIFTSGGQYKRNRCNYFDRKRYELQLVRDFGSGDFETSNKTTVGFYFQPNNPQNNTFNGNSPENYPKYFPKPFGAQLIDASTDEKFVSGLHFGRVDNDTDYNPQGYQANYMFIKNGWSWNKSYTQKQKIYSAYNNPDGYWCWGTDNDATIETDPETGEEVEGGDDTISLAWRQSNRYQAKINNIPNSWCGARDEIYGEGELYQVVWFEKGEHLTLLAVGEANDYRRNTDKTKWSVYPAYMNVTFELDVEPFRTDTSWITINNNGNGYSDMDWNAPCNFLKGQIDLIKFLPNDVKTDEWIDNFCKAFNLKLSQNGLKNFDLDVKQVNYLSTTSVIDLENKANINFRNNTPLNLPSAFELGFSINQDEEGFHRTGDDGGGKFETGTIDGKVLTQTSNFSYGWYKDIKYMGRQNDITKEVLSLPIISNYEVWQDDMTYKEGVSKIYTSYNQRFWYYSGYYYIDLFLYNDNVSSHYRGLTIADVSNTFNQDKILNLDYKNKSNSILTTYFTVVASNDTNYTEIECYLTPDEYDRLDGSNLVKWNGDLYYISSIEGYDITEKNKTKLKLIRKMN